MVDRLAVHVRQEMPTRSQISIAFVRVDTGATGDESAYEEPSKIPAQFAIDAAAWSTFRLWAFEVYRVCVCVCVVCVCVGKRKSVLVVCVWWRLQRDVCSCNTYICVYIHVGWSLSRLNNLQPTRITNYRWRSKKDRGLSFPCCIRTSSRLAIPWSGTGSRPVC
jgi:hypothetical protein